MTLFADTPINCNFAAEKVKPDSKMNREILRIAIPSIVTNITVPMLGMVDLSIAGHIGSGDGSALAIGAISVGGLIFNMVYWLFNFLRMGSSGLTAQRFGREDGMGERRVLRMALTVAAVCGVAIFALQRPIEWFAHWVVAPSDEVWTLAVAYFRVRIWAAPAVLALFALNGWFVGMQNSRYPMYIAIGQNLLNIAESATLVFGFGWGVQGVALGTVISQYCGLAVALVLVRRTPLHCDAAAVASAEELNVADFFRVNRDIFLRMICIIAVTTAFTSLGARQGDVLLAVNTLLIQLFILFSYFCDGFALAGEALVGKYVGARRHEPKMRCVRHLFAWSGGVTLLFTVVYLVAGNVVLRILTDDASVIEAAQPYLPWVLAVPVCGFAAFMWDGIYIGATATRQMLLALAIATSAFFGMWFCPMPLAANHHLWLAFVAYLAVRSGYQTVVARRVLSE